MFLSTRTPLLFLMLISLSLTGCGGNKNKNNTPAATSSSSSSSSSNSSSSSSSSSGIAGPDTQGPSINLVFPGVTGFTTASSITLRGKASDQTGIKSLTVNGAAVTSTNLWADWKFKVDALQDGTNSLLIKAEDTLGQTSEQTIQLSKQTPMFTPELTALDAASNTLFIYDNSLKTIFAVDLTTGSRKVLTQSKTGDTFPFSSPTAMIFDPVKKRLLVSDLDITDMDTFGNVLVGRLTSIDTSTGVRSLFASGALLVDISKASLSLRAPVSLTIDPATRSLYVLDPKAGFVGASGSQLVFDYALLKYPLDAETPTFSLVSENRINKDLPFAGSIRIRFDSLKNRLIAERQYDQILNSNGQATGVYLYNLVSIDPATGIRTALPTPTEASSTFKITQAADYFLDGNFAYYLDRAPTPERFLKIDLTTGVRSEWFSNTATDNKYNLRAVTTVEYNPANKQLFALDAALDAVFKIDTENKFQRTPVAGNGVINENTSLNYLSSNTLLWDQPRQRLLVNNRLEGTINAYDLTTGNTTLFCDFGLKDRATEQFLPVDSALDEAGERLIAVVNHQHLVDSTIISNTRIDSCNLKDGKHSVISSEETATNQAFNAPSAIALDSKTQKAYVLDTAVRVTKDGYAYPENAIIQIDLTNGSRTEYAALQSNENPKGALAFDNNAGRVLFSMLSSASIFSIDPTSKTPSVLSNNLKDSATLLLIPKKLIWQNNQLIALDSARQTLLQVHPDGKRTTLFSITTTGANPIHQIGGMVLDTPNQRLFATDHATGVLALQDLLTGESVYLAK
ncbi:MAG: hypothetical protein RL497_407 [Pseudomonadota bacterium]|jgi:hypothetical protein